jgi:hypothetical protein
MRYGRVEGECETPRFAAGGRQCGGQTRGDPAAASLVQSIGDDEHGPNGPASG